MMKHQLFFSPKGVLALLCLMVFQFACNSDENLEEMTQEVGVKEQPGAYVNSASASATSNFDASLALHWAPIHYQDTDVTGTYSLNGKSDYIAAINFDGDWNATNNWNNTANYSQPAHVYYSVVETGTHWFIIYAFFHPRDWTDNPFLYHLDQHENDLEGVLAIIQKNGTTYGNLQGIVTNAHSDFFSFTPSNSPLQGNDESIDGTLSFEYFNGSQHPLTAQEAKGHGLKAYPYYKLNGDGIKYYPSSSFIAEVPQNADDRYVEYKLVDIFEPNGLWDQRFNTNLFSSEAGNFLSSYGRGGANAPWAWDDGDDVPGRGEIATNPARLVSSYFKNLGNFDFNYIRNKYRGIQ